jgi:hypothetical protein
MPLVVRDRADERRWPILTYVIFGAGGTNDAFSSPQSASCASHIESVTSDLRPGVDRRVR